MSASANGAIGIVNGIPKNHEESSVGIPILNGEEKVRDGPPSKLSLASLAIHADDFLNSGQDVAPPMHVSTTFRYDRNSDNLLHITDRTVSTLIDFQYKTDPGTSKSKFPLKVTFTPVSQDLTPHDLKPSYQVSSKVRWSVMPLDFQPFTPWWSS